MKKHKSCILFIVYVLLSFGIQSADKLDLEGKDRLVCGGILEGSKVNSTNDSVPFLVIANTFSEICERNDFAINLHADSRCQLVGNVWDFENILKKYPSLAAHSFQSIYFNHIGNGFWGDHFTEEERVEFESKKSVEKDVKEKIKNLFAPLISVLGKDGKFVYQSFVTDYLEDFWENTKLFFLTKDVLKQQPQSISEREYRSVSEGQMRRIETAYSLTDIGHPIIRGYFGALRELGLSDTTVEIVVADRTSLEPIKTYELLPEWVRIGREPPTEPRSLQTPDIEKLCARENFNSHSNDNNLNMFDVFLRMKGVKKIA